MLGFLHWLFGNLYEAIVFSPNFIFSQNKLQALEHVRELFKVSPPYFYYLPWSGISILLVIALYFVVKPTKQQSLIKWTSFATIGAILSGIITYFIVTKFNLDIWVGHKQMTEAEFSPIVWTNFLFSLLRIMVVVFTLIGLYKCLVLSIQNLIKSK